MVPMATSPRRRMGMWVMVLVLLLPVSVVGRKVYVSSLQMTPYLMEVKDNVTGDVTYEGYIKDLLGQLGDEMNVDFRIHSLADQFGMLDPATGVWTGLVGKVVRKEVSLVAAPLTINEQRARVVDYSVPFQSFSGVIVLRRVPQPSTPFSERVRFIFRPLEDSVWMAAGVTYMLTGIILYMICYVNPYEWRQMCKDHQATRREAESFTCLNTYWFLLTTFMWQGFIRAPHSLGGRLVVTAWWMFVVVLLLTYTAGLTNLLRVGPPEEEDAHVRVLSLKDLEADGNMDVGFVRGGSTENFLKRAEIPYLKRLYKTVMTRQTHVSSLEEGIQRVRQSYVSTRPFAFITESTVARHLVRQGPCELYMVPDTSLQGSYSLAYPEGWSLKDGLDIALLRLQENGNLRALQHKWSQGPCRPHVLDASLHHAAEEPPFYPANLGSFSGLMLLLAAGVIVGAIVTVVEIVVFKMAEQTPVPVEANKPLKAKGANTASSGAQNVSSAV